MSPQILNPKLLTPPTFLLLLLLLSTAVTATVTTTATAAFHCRSTLFPTLCLSSLLSIPNLAATSLPSIISSTLNTTSSSVISSSQNCSSILRRRHLNPRQRLALSDCIELLGSTLDDLRLAVSDLRGRNSPSRRCTADLSTLLSAAITNQFTCLDGFAFADEGELSVRPQIERRIVRIYRRVSNALALSKKIGSPENCVGRGKDQVFGGSKF